MNKRKLMHNYLLIDSKLATLELELQLPLHMFLAARAETPAGTRVVFSVSSIKIKSLGISKSLKKPAKSISRTASTNEQHALQ